MIRNNTVKSLIYIILIFTCTVLFGSIVYATDYYTLGDIDSDGYITNNDRFIFNKYLSGAAGYTIDMINFQAADIDRDGNITQDDCDILSRYLAGWEGYENLSNFVKETLVENIIVDSTNIMVGETINISALTNGATDNLKFSANIYLDGVKIDYITGNGKLSYKPNDAGVYSFDVSVIDATGKTNNYYLDSCVDVRPFWQLADVTVSNKNINLGTSISFTVNVTGSTNGLVYSYTIYKDGNEYYKIIESSNNSFEFTAGEVGSYSAIIDASDYYEGQAQIIENIIVVSSVESNPLLNVNYGNKLNIDTLNEKDGDEVIVANSSIIFEWNKLSGDSSYRFYISGGPNDAEIEETSYTKNTYTVTTSFLKPGYEYYVSVYHYDSSGNRTSRSSFRFTVSGAESILLEQSPKITSPAKNQIYIHDDVTVCWSKLNYAIKYELVVSYHCGNKYHEIKRVELNGEINSYKILKSDLHIGCEHKVTLYAYDSLGNKLNKTSYFDIEGDKQVYEIREPVITSPEFSDTQSWNKIKTISTYGNIEVTWDEIPAAEYYSLQIEDRKNATSVTIPGADHISDNHYSIPIGYLNSGTIYRVRIYAHHTDDCSEYSDSMYFRAPYSGNRVLNPPKVTSHDLSQDKTDPYIMVKQDFTVAWETVTAAVKYDVDWYWLDDSDYPDFTSYGQTTPSVTIPRDDVGSCGNDEYYVLVITAYDSNDNASFNRYYVRPVSSTITGPVLISPAFTTDKNAAYPAFNENNITIKWGAVSGAVSYRARLCDYYDDEWDEIYVEENIINPTCVLPKKELYSGGRFKLTIRAYDQYGNGRSSDSYYFQVGSSSFIDLTLNDWVYASESSHKYFTVETAGNWNAVKSDSWISIDKDSGVGATRVKVSVSANGGNFARTGNVTFKNSSGGYAVFSITQAPDGSSNAGALKITAPSQGDTVEYSKITAKWSYSNDYAYFNITLKDITSNKVVYNPGEQIVAKSKDIPLTSLSYGHTYQLMISAYNASYVRVSESSVVFKIEDYSGTAITDPDEPIIEEPITPVGETEIMLSGVTDGMIIEKKDIDISWRNVISAETYNVALRDLTEYPDGMDESNVSKLVDKSIKILKDKIPSSVLTAGHTYRLWVAAHNSSDTLITGKSFIFTINSSVTSLNGIPSTDFDNTPIDVVIGDSFEFNGKVYANGGALDQIRITVKESSTGIFCDYAIYDAAAIASYGSSALFDLSNIYHIVTGAGTSIGTSGSGYARSGSQSLNLDKIGNKYIVIVYAKSNNDTQLQMIAQSTIVLISGECITHQSSGVKYYLYSIYNNVESDNNYHNITGIVWREKCSICGENYDVIDTVGYEGNYLPIREKHNYSSKGFCESCGHTCTHDFYDTQQLKQYSGIWESCGDLTHKRLSAIRIYQCSDCLMQKLARISETSFTPEEHIRVTEERIVSVSRLDPTDVTCYSMHQVKINIWEYCKTRAYGCTYERLIDTIYRLETHSFKNGVCECGLSESGEISREDWYSDDVDWSLVYLAEHMRDDDKQFATAIKCLTNRPVDEILGYAWDIVKFDLFGLIKHIQSDVTKAYQEDAAMSILEGLIGSYTEEAIESTFITISEALSLMKKTGEYTFGSISECFQLGDLINNTQYWPEGGGEKFDHYCGVINQTLGVMADIFEDSDKFSEKEATLLLILSNYSTNKSYIEKCMNDNINAGNTEMAEIYKIALGKIDKVYKDTAKEWIHNPLGYISFNTFIDGAELALEIAGIDPVEEGFKALAKNTGTLGSNMQLSKNANILLIVHSTVSWLCGDVLKGNDTYESIQRLYENLTVICSMTNELNSSLTNYLNQPTASNKLDLSRKIIAIGKYKLIVLENCEKYRTSNLTGNTFLSSSQIKTEKANVQKYMDIAEDISNGRIVSESLITQLTPIQHDDHGYKCKICALN